MVAKIISLLAALSLTLLVAGGALSADYQHSLDVDKMNFSWSINGDQLAGKVSGPTTGWVAVGFNPSNKMKDANIVIGYVKKGKVTIKDDFGSAATQHKTDKKVGGAENVTTVGGSEEGGVTTIEFTMPLNSGDDKDNVLDPNGDTVVILAYGTERDSFRTKHKYHATLTVNLASGERK